jgi:hypothetical protein
MKVFQIDLPGFLLGRSRLENFTIAAHVPIRLAQLTHALLIVYTSIHAHNL